MKPSKASEQKLDRLVAKAIKARDARERGYREQALKLYPWVCARCGRAFDRPRLHELTVHHRDHDHENNPSDGSNWELLCLYCHDDEHARGQPRAAGEDNGQPKQTFKPFEHLRERLKTKA